MAAKKDHSTTAGGGGADKRWNEYETAWTLQCGVIPVMKGDFAAITVEPAGGAGKGVEFRLHSDTGSEVHQVKGGLDRSWTINDLDKAGVLSAFKTHLSDPNVSAVFVSVRPAVDLASLCDKAKLEAHEWLGELSGKDEKHAAALKTIWTVDDDGLHGLLRRIAVRNMDDSTLPDFLERDLEALVEGRSPEDARSDLRTYVFENLHLRLTSRQLWDAIHAKGGRPRRGGPDPASSELVRDLSAAYTRSVEQTRPTVLARIARPQVDQAVEMLTRANGPGAVAIVGPAGSGKSTVCAEVVERLEARGVVVGALRLDPATPASTAGQLGSQEAVGFGGPIADVMRRAAAGSPCVLVVDQLDALSAAAGRGEAIKEGMRETLQQLKAVPGLRVLLACRSHDLREDRDLRLLVQTASAAGPARLPEIEIGGLDDHQVDTALRSLGMGQTTPSAPLRALLRNAFNLSLLARIVEDAYDQNASATVDPAEFQTRIDLLREYNKRIGAKIRRHFGPNDFAGLTQRVAHLMAKSGLLSVSTDQLSDATDTLAALLSEGVLFQSGRRVRFFHQAYFEFVFAQQQVVAGRTAMDQLRDHEQEFVRRGLVRMLLALEREQDPAGAYPADLRAVLAGPEVRTHVRAAVLDWMTELEDLTAEETALVHELAVGPSRVRRRALSAMWTPNWIFALHRQGFFSSVVQHLLSCGCDVADSPATCATHRLDAQTAWLLLEAAVRCAPEQTAVVCMPLARDPKAARRHAGRLLRLVFVAGPGAHRAVADLFSAIAASISTDAGDEPAVGNPATSQSLSESAIAIGDLFGDNGTNALHNLAQKDPLEAVGAYGAWFTAAEAIAEGFGTAGALDPSGDGPLPEGSAGLGALQKLADTEPAATAELLVPFVLKQALAAVRETDPEEVKQFGPARPDRIWPAGVPTEHGFADEVLRATTSALATTVEREPGRGRRLLADLASSDLLTASHLACAAYSNASPNMLDEALDWAAADDHRRIDTRSPGRSAWGHLLARVIATGSSAQKERAVALILTPYADLDLPSATGRDAAAGNPPADDTSARELYAILQTVQATLASGFPDPLEAPLATLRSHLGNPTTTNTFRSGGGFNGVVDPIPRQEATLYTDDEWIQAMARIPHSEHTFAINPPRLIGGAKTLALTLGACAAAEPLRFARLLSRMAPPINDAYPNAVLDALARKQDPIDDEVSAATFAAIRTVHAWDRQRHADAICHILSARASAQLPSDVLEILAWIAREHENPASEVWTEPSNNGEPYFGGNITDAGLNCTRGYAVYTLGKLMSTSPQQPGRLDPLTAALRSTINDTREQVRVMIPEALLSLATKDPAAACELTSAWLQNATDPMFQASHLDDLAFQVYSTDALLATEIADRMLQSSSAPARIRAGYFAAAVALRAHYEQSMPPALFTTALDDAAGRHGVGVYLVECAQWLANDLDQNGAPHTPAPGWNLLLQLLDDPDPEVHRPVTTALGNQLMRLDTEPAGFEEFLARLAGTRGFLSAGFQVLRSLHLGRLHLPPTAVQLCRTWLAGHHDNLANPGTAARASAEHLIPIILSVYGRSTKADTRSLCLDLIDEMIESGIDEASRAADEADPSA